MKQTRGIESYTHKKKHVKVWVEKNLNQLNYGVKDSISPSSNSDQDLVSWHDIHVHVLEKAWGVYAVLFYLIIS